MICERLRGPDSGGARWICRTEYITGYLLFKVDGIYLLNSDSEDIEMIGSPHSLADDDEELGHKRPVTYCPICKNVNKTEG